MLFVWDLATRRATMKLNAKKEYVGLNGVMLLPDTSHVITWTGEGRIDTWDLSKQVVRVGIKRDGRSNDVDITPDGKFYVIGGKDVIIRAVNAANVDERRFKGHTDPVNAVTVSHIRAAARSECNQRAAGEKRRTDHHRSDRQAEQHRPQVSHRTAQGAKKTTRRKVGPAVLHLHVHECMSRFPVEKKPTHVATTTKVGEFTITPLGR